MFASYCQNYSLQEFVDMNTLASHSADLSNGPAVGDISAYDLDHEITSFVRVASKRTCMACMLSNA